ncbi:CoA transferase [Nonomuraea typhae]|uniref:CoA transferase n=1 Tax=Nonomuraea typhae TaxID=2603600 RepID=UPI0012F933C5|nr:CoA transferase [Nonomuraea typhae]
MAGPLAGTLVLDLSRALAGQHAAMMLGDMGARVIKVESPEGRAMLERLVGRADVLIENFRPGVLDRLGFPVIREHWRRFAVLVGVDPAEFPDNTDRVARHPALVERLETVLKTRPRRHWLNLLAADGVPAGAIRTIEEVYTWEQTESQGLVIEVDHPATGPVRLPGPPLRVGRADGTSLDRTRHLPPPLLGEHDETIRTELHDGLLA